MIKYETGVIYCCAVFALTLGFQSAIAEEIRPEPIIVNGDTVEYGTDNKEVTATGNVEVNYKGSKLTCDKLTVNMQNKVGTAEGHARLDDNKGIIEGSKIVYDFQNKTGTIFDSNFRANPYFGKTKRVEKVSDSEFVAFDGFATTCNFDHPHYRLGSKEVRIFPQDKIQTKDDAFYVGDTPLMRLSNFNRSLKDTAMHQMLIPGYRKEWGPFLLSSWRYNLNDYLNARVFLDYRVKLGLAEGFGLNSNTPNFGKGDFKFYYTDEHPEKPLPDTPVNLERYFTRFRYKWDIDNQTSFVSEFYKIVDERRKTVDPQTNLLKDYFFREYQADSQPPTYATFHHNFSHSAMDLTLENRTNHYFDQINKLPELKYTLPSLRLNSTPFYFQNNTSAGSYNKKAITSPVTADDQTAVRLDTTNKFSMPVKLAFLRVNPFVGSEETFYNTRINGADFPVRTIFLSGVDVSTKFYRLFNVRSNLLGMDINGLRHIITPTIGYAYSHTPTIPAINLTQIDTIDALGPSNAVSLGLSNKLQTKLKGVSRDLVDALVTTSYAFKPKTADKRGSSFRDILFDIKLLPYSWLRLDTTATYTHSGPRDSANYNSFSEVNYDVSFNWTKERILGIGQRYLKKGGNQITSYYNWRFSPKWKFLLYQRYEIGHDKTLSKGLREQEYTLSRDLHCWTVDCTLNLRRSGGGATIWLIFRLKAFPESEFSFQQNYSSPKTGPSTN
jgi:LPS-assembly protein